ncbi:unannotated protein [freshwater metagenome]|uniref:Unannotated protein n=1 Tax=freshwater metagenome TaxID=449393 RepID=A0A6J6H1N1_9ZZZZ
MNRASWCRTGDQNGHGDPRRVGAERSIGSGCGRSSAEFVAALGATVLQDCAAGTSAHARTKAMLTKFASVIGLKGALHGASYWDMLRGRSDEYKTFLHLRCETNAQQRLTEGNGLPPEPSKFGLSTSPATVISPGEIHHPVIHSLWISLWRTQIGGQHEQP